MLGQSAAGVRGTGIILIKLDSRIHDNLSRFAKTLAIAVKGRRWVVDVFLFVIFISQKHDMHVLLTTNNWFINRRSKLKSSDSTTSIYKTQTKIKTSVISINIPYYIKRKVTHICEYKQ